MNLFLKVRSPLFKDKMRTSEYEALSFLSKMVEKEKTLEDIEEREIEGGYIYIPIGLRRYLGQK